MTSWLAAAHLYASTTMAAAKHRFPPNFEGEPLTYGAALFSLTLICAFSISMLLQFVFEARERRIEWRKAGNPGKPPTTPLSVHRAIISGFLVMVLVGAGPDVFVLYAWGEASDEMIDSLFFIDRAGDALSLWPFMWAVLLSAWGLEILPDKLVRETRVEWSIPGRGIVIQKLKIVLATLVIATGVTMAKASG